MKKEIDFRKAIKPFPNKRYSIIYADPPWSYSNAGVNGAAAKHYATLTCTQICKLPVSEIVEQDCILFLWSTFPHMNEALKLIQDWGFKYTTAAFVWIKENKKSDGYFLGPGFWTRANAEICLLAKKGNPKRVSKSVRQLVVSKVREHSQKPDEVRDRILELCGDLPRIELFARQKTPGWDVWGDEV